MRTKADVKETRQLASSGVPVALTPPIDFILPFFQSAEEG